VLSLLYQVNIKLLLR